MRTPFLLLSTIALFTLPGCAAQTSADHALTDTSWRFVTIDGAPVTSKTARLEFEGDRLGANVGCNSMGGPWRVEEQRLLAGPLSHTEMYCGGPVWSQEQATTLLLAAAPQVEITGDRLELRSSGHSAELERIAPNER